MTAGGISRSGPTPTVVVLMWWFFVGLTIGRAGESAYGTKETLSYEYPLPYLSADRHTRWLSGRRKPGVRPPCTGMGCLRCGDRRHNHSCACSARPPTRTGPAGNRRWHRRPGRVANRVRPREFRNDGHLAYLRLRPWPRDTRCVWPDAA